MAQQAWEQRITDEMDRRSDELLQLAGDLIRIPSENPDGDCTEVANFTAGWLRDRGIDCELFDEGDGRVNAVAHLDGAETGERHLALSGHYDVVPVGNHDRWTFPPFAGDVVDGWLRGRGASDMKAGLAGTMFAMVVLKDLQVPFRGKVTFAGMCDEEGGGPCGTPTVLDQGHLEGVTGAVIGEPSERAFPTIGQKGCNRLHLTFDGVPGHGSLQPLHGTNANLLAAKAVLALQKLWDMTPVVDDPELLQLIKDSKIYAEEREGYEPGISRVFEHVTINIGTMSGGTGVNVVADHAEVDIDTRIPVGLTRDEVNRRVTEILEEEGIPATVEDVGFKSDPNWTLPSDPIVSSLVEVLQDIADPEAMGVLQWASSDARCFRQHGIPVLQYGPAELATIHGYDERCRADQVILATTVYARTAVRYLGLQEQ